MARTGISMGCRVCRLAFCLCCLLPTLGVAGWSVAKNIPGRAVPYEAWIGQLVDGRCRIARLSYPRPGAVALCGLEVVDPETGSKLIASGVVETTWRGGGLHLTMDEGEISEEFLARLQHLAARWLRGSWTESCPTFDLTAQRLKLRAGDGDAILHGLRVRCRTTSEGPSASLRFRQSADERSEPIRVDCTRRTKQRRPTTTLTLTTGATGMPCQRLATWCALGKWLGPRSRLAGVFTLQSTRHGTKANFKGELSEIDLETLVGVHFGQRLTGDANLELTNATFEGGRLVAAEGTLRAGPGFIGADLLQSAARNLALRVGTSLSRGDTTGYQQLAIGFSLENRRLTLSGACDKPASARALVVDQANHPLLNEADSQPQDVWGIVGMLAPQAESFAPATIETEPLLRRLPLTAGRD